MTVPVRPDGKVTTPLVDDLPALGKTPTMLARGIEKALAAHPGSGGDRRCHQLRRTEQRADPGHRRSGEAADPRLPQNMTLLDVMIAVGGLTDFADGNKASIYRVAESGKSYSVRVQDLVKRGDITANVDMRPGDILIIPQSWF
jgi:polysaccharide export outer membrane protein